MVRFWSELTDRSVWEVQRQQWGSRGDREGDWLENANTQYCRLENVGLGRGEKGVGKNSGEEDEEGGNGIRGVKGKRQRGRGEGKKTKKRNR